MYTRESDTCACTGRQEKSCVNPVGVTIVGGGGHSVSVNLVWVGSKKKSLSPVLILEQMNEKQKTMAGHTASNHRAGHSQYVLKTRSQKKGVTGKGKNPFFPTPRG